MSMYQLKTERLNMRTVTEDDAAIVLDVSREEFTTTEEVLDWMGWMKKTNAKGRLIIMFYIWLAETNQCVGRVYIHSKPELGGEVEIGYSMSEEHRNCGYMTEAAGAVVRFAFEEAGQDVLAAIVKPDNIASRRVIEKLGFTRKSTRTLPDETGIICDFDYFRLERTDQNTQMTNRNQRSITMKHTEIIANDWNLGSDKYFETVYQNGVVEHIIEDPMWAFPIEVRAMLSDAFPDFHGKRVLVPSSGNNGAVFAFHLMGAKVTSADIAENQLANAKRIADAHGWEIEFVQDDTMKLEHVRDGEYDLVYTSNGVHVWINDLAAMYRSFHRVLKPGGSYIMFETHPYIRPFDTDAADKNQFVVIKLYEDLGPYGEVPTMCWRIMDIANAMLNAGLAVGHMEEFHSKIGSFDCWWYDTEEEAEADGYAKCDWTRNPFAALPQWIGFSAKKI